MSFIVATVQTGVEALDLTDDLEHAVLIQLISALNLERVAGRRPAATRHRLLALATQRIEPLRYPTHPTQALAPPLRARSEIEGAQGCADLLQRSS